MRTDLALNALEQAIWLCCPPPRVVHHYNHGSQGLSTRYTERLSEICLETPTGSEGNSSDNALADTTIGHYRREVIHQHGPWRTIDAVRYATLSRMDSFNNCRLLEPIANMLPAELEMQCLQQQQESAIPARLKGGSLRQGRGSSSTNQCTRRTLRFSLSREVCGYQHGRSSSKAGAWRQCGRPQAWREQSHDVVHTLDDLALRSDQYDPNTLRSSDNTQECPKRIRVAVVRPWQEIDSGRLKEANSRLSSVLAHSSDGHVALTLPRFGHDQSTSDRLVEVVDQHVTRPW